MRLPCGLFQPHIDRNWLEWGCPETNPKNHRAVLVVWYAVKRSEDDFFLNGRDLAEHTSSKVVEKMSDSSVVGFVGSL